MRTIWKLLRNKTNLTFLLSLTFLFLFSGCMRGQETVKKKYYDNGKLKRETHFKNGKRDGLDTWFYETGEKMFEVHVKNRRAEGLRTTWFESGKKKSEAHFKNGKRDGLFTKWSITGEKKIRNPFQEWGKAWTGNLLVYDT